MSHHLDTPLAAQTGQLVTNTAVRSGLKPSVAKDQRASDFPYVIPA
jgi:hypothetical protein